MSPNEPLRPDRTIMESDTPPPAGRNPSGMSPALGADDGIAGGDGRPEGGRGHGAAAPEAGWGTEDDWAAEAATTVPARGEASGTHVAAGFAGAHPSGEVPWAYRSGAFAAYAEDEVPGAYRGGAYHSEGSGAYRSGQARHVATGTNPSAVPATPVEDEGPRARIMLADRRLRFAGVVALWLFSLVGGLVVGAVTRGDDPVDNPSTEIGDTVGDWSDAPSPGGGTPQAPVTSDDALPGPGGMPGGAPDEPRSPVTTRGGDGYDRPGGTTATTEGNDGTSPTTTPSTTEDDGGTSPTTSPSTTEDDPGPDPTTSTTSTTSPTTTGTTTTTTSPAPS